jgi:hypothetical protein
MVDIGTQIMTKIEAKLGEYNYITRAFGPGISISIDGDHDLALEVFAYLKKFESTDIIVEVR